MIECAKSIHLCNTLSHICGLVPPHEIRVILYLTPLQPSPYIPHDQGHHSVIPARPEGLEAGVGSPVR
jgi:hypothetical protein